MPAKRNARSSPKVDGSNSAVDPTIKAVAKIEHDAYRARTSMDHLAGWITRRAGSGTAIVLHLIWFGFWLLINIGAVSGITPFDPFPFNLLTMVVSLEAIFLTLFVLISQNRMSQEADKRAQLDLQVNLLAERETTMILQMLERISEKLGIPESRREDLLQLLKETRVEELAKKLDQALPTEEK